MGPINVFFRLMPEGFLSALILISRNTLIYVELDILDTKSEIPRNPQIALTTRLMDGRYNSINLRTAINLAYVTVCTPSCLEMH